ncbi:MAG: hypothetical protein COB30_000870 [Ectothiorhodospiraceae bacterium]|nr:hypothetical protein [Ectothiorhodospiraceae bacterium]
MKHPLFFIIVFFISISVCNAAPFTPENENLVIYQVEKTALSEKLESLRINMLENKTNSSDLEAYVAFSINVARKKSDPRYFGYAKAALQPTIKQYFISGTHTGLLIHWADIMQFMHQFDEAERTLQRVINISRDNPRTNLMLSAIYQAQGRYPEALKQCNALFTRTSMLVLTACITQIKSLTGNLKDSFTVLSKQVYRESHSNAVNHAWVLSILAEMSERLNKNDQAADFFTESLRLDPLNGFTRSAYADFLLDQGKYRQVKDILSDHLFTDGLLLRYTMADVHSKSNHQSTRQEIRNNIEKLHANYSLSQKMDGDSHLRDQAIFYLYLKKQQSKALALAKSNWEIYKEPADARILLRCAHLAGDEKTINQLREWKESNRYENAVWDQIMNMDGLSGYGKGTTL